MEEQKNSLFSYIGDIVETIVVAAAIFVVVYLFLIQPHQVRGGSMEPNFFDKEYILTDKLTYRFSKPKRGDVIICRAPKNADYDFIKRVIALPSEKIKIEDGKIIITNKDHPNGERLFEPYNVEGITTGGSSLSEGSQITVGDDQYFVLGDNRNHSSDSREWGPVPKSNIVGKTWLRYWPLNRIDFIKGTKYLF